MAAPIFATMDTSIHLILADYVDDEVPKVAEQHFNRKQVPNLHNAGQSFQIVSSR